MKKRLLAFSLIVALVVSLGGTSFAADASDGNTFTVVLSCIDWGEPVSGIVIELEEALADDMTADDVAAALTVTALGITYSEMDMTDYSTVMKTADFEREIASVEISEDRTVVTVDFVVTYGDNANSKDFEMYAVKLGELELDYAGTVSPAADRFARFDAADTGLNVNYRLFTPEIGEGNRPLIVWLHGAGEFGTDNNIHLTANFVTNWASDEVQEIFGGAYVAAIQSFSVDTTTMSGHVPANIMAAIERIYEENPEIDLTRVYIGGCSMGGLGTFETILAYPDFFAAAFPVCPAKELTAEEAARLANLPIYQITSIDDPLVLPTGTAANHELLVAAGNENAHITLFDVVSYDGVSYFGHFSWVYAHRNFPSEGITEHMLSTPVDFETSPMIYGQSFSYTGAVSENPTDFGYDTFMDWLADQQKDEEPVLPAIIPFIDVPGRLYTAVTYLYENGITNGYTANTFAPARGLTRAEFMTFLCRVAGTASGNDAATFDDCIGHWANGYINWGVENGLLQGYGDGKFGPEDSLTVDQVNIILGRFNAEFDTQISIVSGEGDVTRGQVALVLFDIAQ